MEVSESDEESLDSMERETKQRFQSLDLKEGERPSDIFLDSSMHNSYVVSGGESKFSEEFSSLVSATSSVLSAKNLEKKKDLETMVQDLKKEVAYCKEDIVRLQRRVKNAINKQNHGCLVLFQDTDSV